MSDFEIYVADILKSNNYKIFGRNVHLYNIKEKELTEIDILLYKTIIECKAGKIDNLNYLQCHRYRLLFPDFKIIIWTLDEEITNDLSYYEDINVSIVRNLEEFSAIYKEPKWYYINDRSVLTSLVANRDDSLYPLKYENVFIKESIIIDSMNIIINLEELKKLFRIITKINIIKDESSLPRDYIRVHSQNTCKILNASSKFYRYLYLKKCLYFNITVYKIDLAEIRSETNFITCTYCNREICYLYNDEEKKLCKTCLKRFHPEIIITRNIINKCFLCRDKIYQYQFSESTDILTTILNGNKDICSKCKEIIRIEVNNLSSILMKK